jgi:uncharacterized protein YukE
MAFACPAPAVDACTGGGASACLAKIQGSPPAIAGTAAQRLHQAAQFVRIIEDLSTATQSLQQAWSGEASEAAVQKIMSTIGSFIRIVDAIQQGAALLNITGGLIASAQTGYCGVMSSVNPTVASMMSNPWTYSAAQALASGSLASVNTWITVIQAAIHVKGAGQIMQQVAMLTTIMMDIERLAQGGGNAASDASALIGLYRAGKMEANSLNPPSNPSSMSGAMSSPQGDQASPDFLNG